MWSLEEDMEQGKGWKQDGDDRRNQRGDEGGGIQGGEQE